MNRGLQACESGLRCNQFALDVLSNNLANIGTHGFKRDGIAFSEALVRQMSVPSGSQERLIGSLGSGPTATSRYTVAESGGRVKTGNPLDVCLLSVNQYLAIRTPSGIRYTRDGSLAVSQNGTLTTHAGHEVLDIAGNPIRVEVASSGVVRIDEQAGVWVGDNRIGVLDIREGLLTKEGSNLWFGETQPVLQPSIAVGELEASNVNAIETMVQVLSVMRNFESVTRAMTIQDEMTGRLVQSLAG